MTELLDPLTLPSGLTLPNRLAKAALTEGLAGSGRPNRDLQTLYRRWASTGVGLFITGNVQNDRHHIERPGNVIIDRRPDAAMHAALKDWAEAAKSSGGKIVMQISHAGRQTPARVNKRPKAPSAVPLRLPGRQFGEPVELSAEEIGEIPGRFVLAAEAAREAGFDGVQLHAAHGYLLSEFLSPLANRREDQWGGSLENRARLLLDSVRAVRAALGKDFTLSVKLNSSDFQKGGFLFEESLTVAGWLKEEGIDFLEISGGTYEQPKMMDLEGLDAHFEPKSESTRVREAYSADFAKQMLQAQVPPLMVTGGFRTAEGMNEALRSGVALIGIGRPICAAPESVAALLQGQLRTLPLSERGLRLGPGLFGPSSSVNLLKGLNGFAVTFWYYQQIRRLGRGEQPDLKLSVLRALIAELRDDTRQLREWRAAADALDITARTSAS